MEILEKGFSVRNIKDVLSEEMINYLIQLTDIFPFVENNKEEILRKRVSSIIRKEVQMIHMIIRKV